MYEKNTSVQKRKRAKPGKHQTKHCSFEYRKTWDRRVLSWQSWEVCSCHG